MTVLDLIKASLRVLGAISSTDTPSSEMVTDAREALNLLLEEWHNFGLVSLTEQQTFNVVSGTLSYSIGSGETWDGNKPLKILAAYLTLDDIDYPLAIISEKEYMEIAQKDTSCRPTLLFYLPSNSTGTVYLYGEPDDTYTITMLSQKAFTAYTSGSTVIDLPNGYLSALKYNLAAEIAPEYEKNGPPQWVVRRATETLAAIKRTNLKKPAAMKFDHVLTGKNRVYDITSDTFL